METLAAEVWGVLDARCPGAILVAHGGTARGLAQFFARGWWVTLRARLGRRGDVLMTGDALTYVMMWPLATVLRIPCVTMAMGLDLTFPNPVYRAAIRLILPRGAACLRSAPPQPMPHGTWAFHRRRCALIPLAIRLPPPPSASEKADARRAVLHGCHLPNDSVLLLTMGRLVARKGVRWFVAEVIPQLPDSVHYIIAGSGPDRENIERAIGTAGLGSRVTLLGRVGDDERELLLRGVDIFVQPNIPIPGDMEGFGLVTLEASLRATPVVASELEGLRDAVVDGETGIFCPPADAEAWSTQLRKLIADPEGLKQTGEHFRTQTAALYRVVPRSATRWSPRSRPPPVARESNDQRRAVVSAVLDRPARPDVRCARKAGRIGRARRPTAKSARRFVRPAASIGSRALDRREATPARQSNSANPSHGIAALRARRDRAVTRATRSHAGTATTSRADQLHAHDVLTRLAAESTPPDTAA